MLLTQKPQPINFSRHHRRHPASISVVPHPSSTPGLLTLSKPQRQPSRHPQRPQSPRFPQRNRLHRPATASVADLPSTTLFNPDPTRGRPHQNKAPQPQQQRSASQVQLPDTPVVADPAATALPFPAQQQAATLEPPTLAALPSGRLARSRRTRNKSTPAAEIHFSPERTRAPRAPTPTKVLQPSAPIAVPNARRAPSPAHKVLSRSDPLSKLSIHTNLAAPSKRKDKRRRNKAKRAVDGDSLPLAEWDFPAPGSSDDDVEEEDDEPVTPLGQTGATDKAWQRALNDGPRTAPLQPKGAQASGQFPFFQFPLRATPPRTKTPGPAPVTTNKQVRPDHRRAPSQPASLGRASTAPADMFHMSEDEADALPAGADVREKMAMLFGTGTGNGTASPLFPITGSPSPSPRKQRAPRERESVDGVARQLFASSSFQLAPEPVDLPKPSFLLSIRA